MAKTKVETKQLNAVWEIIEAAEFIDNLEKAGKQPSIEELIQIYRGNFVPLLYDLRITTKQVFKVVIQIKYLQDGENHYDTLEWGFGTPMTFYQVLKGNKAMVIKEAGLSTIWQGVGHEWSNYVRKNFTNRTDRQVISAWATATCTSKVKPLKFNHIYSYLAAELNKDFRTGKYLL